MSAQPGTAPYVLENKGTFDAPYTLPVPASLEIRPDTATAVFDGTGSSGPFLACLTFYGSDGERLCRMYNPNPVPMGGVAEVTYIPPFGSAATSASTGGGIDFDKDNEGGWFDLTANNTDSGGRGVLVNDASGGYTRLVNGGSRIDLNRTADQIDVVAHTIFSTARDISELNILGSPTLVQASQTAGKGNVALRVRATFGGLELSDDGTNALFLINAKKLGFYNHVPATQQTVTGSRGGNAALASLLSSLATLGLIIDGSTP